jgi:hypothetical protein
VVFRFGGPFAEPLLTFDRCDEDTVPFEAKNSRASSSSSEASIMMAFLSFAFSFEFMDRSLEEFNG